MTVSLGNGVDIGNIVTAETNPLTGGSDFLSAVSTLKLPVGVTDLTGGIGGVDPSYLPPGNGIDSDHVAFLSKRDSVGVGGTIMLKPGATYILDRTVRLLDGQTIDGRGAIIRRAAQSISTTTTVITSDVTNTITVATGDGVKFKVGQLLNVYSGGTGGSLAVTISNITGDVITCSSAFRMAVGSPWSGATVATSYNTLELVDNCLIKNVTIDGNSANNPYAAWQTTCELQLRGQNIVVDSCAVMNAPGEGVLESGVTPFTDTRNQIRNNKITSVKGNGVHLSASYGTQIINNFIYDCNSNGAAVGHSGGCITLSDYVAHVLISGNHLEKGRAGVGQVDSATNSIITISNNTIVDMTEYMIECIGNTFGLNNVKVVNNRFSNTVAPATSELISVAIEDVGTTEYVTAVVVSGNTFNNSGLALSRVSGCAVSGNVFNTTYQTADIYHNPARVKNVVNCVFSGNSVVNGHSGIYVLGNNTDLLITNNSFRLGHYFGICITGGAGNANVTYANNTITNDTNANVSYQGIVAGANTTVRGNTITMVAGHSGIRVYGTPRCVVSSNNVRSYAATKTIRIESGSTGYVVVDNQVNYAVTDVPGVGVRVANNDVIV